MVDEADELAAESSCTVTEDPEPVAAMGVEQSTTDELVPPAADAAAAAADTEPSPQDLDLGSVLHLLPSYDQQQVPYDIKVN